MKFTNLKTFKQSLTEKKPFFPIYLLLSDDDYERKEALSVLTNGQKAKTFDGAAAEINQILEELNSLSLFSNSRAVIIDRAEKLTSEKFHALEDYLETPNPNVHLVLTASSFDKRKSFYKKAEKIGLVLDLAIDNKYAKESRLVEKIIDMAKTRGKTIPAHICQKFIKYVGRDQSHIIPELEKLICYIGDKTSITEKDIYAVCIGVNTDNIWQLGDAIFNKNGALALTMMRKFIEEIPLFVLLRQIRTQFQNKCKLAELLSFSANEAEIQKHFPYMKGNILQMNINTVNRFGLENLKEGILLIDDTEYLAKNSGLTPDFLIDRLIFKLMALS